MDLELLKQKCITESNDRISSLSCFTTGIKADTFFIACDTWLLEENFLDFNPKRLPKQYHGKK